MHCDKGNRDFTFSRTVVETALTVYIDQKLSVKAPVQCLDLSIEKTECSRWKSKYGTAVKIVGPNTKPVVNDSGETNFESNYSVVERTDFNFIYVECITDGSSYFDCVFRKIARNGLFGLATSDDPALYGRPPEPALRCYAGQIARTFYAPEMAVRLILAAMARSAARFSKSIEVILAVVIKNSITILVKVKKGAESSVNCLREIKTLVHCTVCEERAFLPHNDGYVVENVQQYLSCDCASENVGRTVLALGPLWSAAIGNPSYLSSLLPHLSHSLQLTTFITDLITELRCESKMTREDTNSVEVSGKCPRPEEPDSLNDTQTPSNNSISLKRKADTDLCNTDKKSPKCENTDPKPAPAFYYNIHKHKPKGTENLLKVDKIIDLLHRQGFRASRTFFDRAAVKTNATLKQLLTVSS